MALTAYLTEKEIAEKDTTNVSLQEEEQAAVPYLQAFEKENLLVKDTISYIASLKILRYALHQFLEACPNRRWKNYEIYILKSNAINAFTVGGKIFFTTALLNKVNQNTSMLTFILLHEIGHNELKHLYYQIKRKKALGELIAKSGEMLFFSLNQFNELEADCFAIDVMKYLKLKPLESIQFFSLLQKEDNKEVSTNYYLEKIFTTHPLHSERKECLEKFIHQK